MSTFTYDWNGFADYKSWVRMLEESCESVSDVHNQIVKTLGGNKKIKNIKGYHSWDNGVVKFCEVENTTLLKRFDILCIKEVERINVEEIDKVVFKKVHEDSVNEYYVIIINSRDYYWKYEIIV